MRASLREGSRKAASSSAGTASARTAAGAHGHISAWLHPAAHGSTSAMVSNLHEYQRRFCWLSFTMGCAHGCSPLRAAKDVLRVPPRMQARVSVMADSMSTKRCCSTCKAGRQAPQPLPGRHHQARGPLLQRGVQRQLQPRSGRLNCRAKVRWPCALSSQVTKLRY